MHSPCAVSSSVKSVFLVTFICTRVVQFIILKDTLCSFKVICLAMPFQLSYKPNKKLKQTNCLCKFEINLCANCVLIQSVPLNQLSVWLCQKFIKVVLLTSLLFFSCIFLLLQAEWVALNYVPFAERSLEVLVDLYHKTACHKAVINEKVLQNIIKVFSPGWGV